MAERKCIFIKEGEKLPESIQVPNKFIDRGKNCFVGVYFDSKRKMTIIGLPKYYMGCIPDIDEKEKSLILDHMGLICRLIEKIRLDSNYVGYRFNSYENSAETNVNKLELARFLLNDYLENGIYGFYQNNYVTDGSGLNDWNRTVEKGIPIINGDTIVYDPVIARKSEYNQNDIVSKIHVAVLKEALAIWVWDDYQYVEIKEQLTDWDYGVDFDFFLSVLYTRLNATFVERDKNLLKGLIAWCRLTANNEKYFIGSTSFEHIWEYTINSVFGNISNKKSGVPYYYKFDRTKYIPYASRGDSIPDSIRIEDDNCEKYFHIIDAKYYVWKENERELIIEAAPANSDISKQIGYYYYLKALYNAPDRIFTNSFFVPNKSIIEADKLLYYWGVTQQNSDRNPEILKIISDIPNKVSLEKVTVFVVNPTNLYKLCLLNRKVSKEFLKDMFDSFERDKSKDFFFFENEEDNENA